MTSVLGLLDDAPVGRDDPELHRLWSGDVARSLETHPDDWVEAVGTPQQPGLSKDRAWRLLGWVEDVAPTVVTERRPQLVETAAFAMSLLEASPLDRRDVMVVAALVRRASDVAGFDYPDLVRSGCERAGPLGERALQWLWWVSETVPATHEETGEGATFGFRRKPSDIDVDRLENWLKGSG